MEVYNSDGQLIYGHFVEIDGEWRLNENLSKGVYILRFQSEGTSNSGSVKIVV